MRFCLSLSNQDFIEATFCYQCYLSRLLTSSRHSMWSWKRVKPWQIWETWINTSAPSIRHLNTRFLENVVYLWEQYFLCHVLRLFLVPGTYHHHDQISAVSEFNKSNTKGLGVRKILSCGDQAVFYRIPISPSNTKRILAISVLTSNKYNWNIIYLLLSKEVVYIFGFIVAIWMQSRCKFLLSHFSPPPEHTLYLHHVPPGPTDLPAALITR